MKSTTKMCLKCKHKADRKNTTHISCTNPVIEMVGVKTAARYLEIEAVLYGIMEGWFTWPYHFDPTWLIKCVGFEKDDTGKKTEL